MTNFPEPERYPVGSPEREAEQQRKSDLYRSAVETLSTTNPPASRAREELLPCPFCGSTNIDAEGWSSTDSAGPACDDCGASAGAVSKSLQENIAEWNRRAPTAYAATRRERIATAAMQGLVAKIEIPVVVTADVYARKVRDIASVALDVADALIAELGRKGEEG
jgi:Lar family restriction alleviation protein